MEHAAVDQLTLGVAGPLRVWSFLTRDIPDLAETPEFWRDPNLSSRFFGHGLLLLLRWHRQPVLAKTLTAQFCARLQRQ